MRYVLSAVQCPCRAPVVWAAAARSSSSVRFTNSSCVIAMASGESSSPISRAMARAVSMVSSGDHLHFDAGVPALRTAAFTSRGAGRGCPPTRRRSARFRSRRGARKSPLLAGEVLRQFDVRERERPHRGVAPAATRDPSWIWARVSCREFANCAVGVAELGAFRQDRFQRPLASVIGPCEDFTLATVVVRLRSDEK